MWKNKNKIELPQWEPSTLKDGDEVIMTAIDGNRYLCRLIDMTPPKSTPSTKAS